MALMLQCEARSKFQSRMHVDLLAHAGLMLPKCTNMPQRCKDAVCFRCHPELFFCCAQVSKQEAVILNQTQWPRR